MALSEITDTLSQLSTCVEKIEYSPSVPTVTAEVTQSNQAPRSDETFPIFGMPAITAAVSTKIDLSQKHILWAKVESVGVAIPLPIDSCFSVNLVSEVHAIHVMKQHTTLAFERYPTPVPVTVVSPDTQLKVIKTKQLSIRFGPDAESLFVCLVVRRLCWLMLCGHNHLQSTGGSWKSPNYISSSQYEILATVSLQQPAVAFSITCIACSNGESKCELSRVSNSKYCNFC